jgi:hypothetical protein
MKCLTLLSLKWIVSNLDVFETLPVYSRSEMAHLLRKCSDVCLCVCGKLSAGWMWHCNCYSEGQQLTASSHVGTTLHLLHSLGCFKSCRNGAICLFLCWQQITVHNQLDGHHRTNHEDPEGEYRHICTFSLTSVLDAGGWSTPRRGRFAAGYDTVFIV